MPYSNCALRGLFWGALMIQNLTKAALFVGLIITVSCSSRIYDPNYWHSSFVAGLQRNVGYSFASVRDGVTGGWAPYKSQIDQLVLANGNIAYKYSHLRTCHYILEVNPKTDIIVNANWEGEKGDCIIVP